MNKLLLGLYPALILLAAVASNYPDMRESWGLGGPGARHAGDVEPELARGVGPDLPHVLDARSMIYTLIPLTITRFL